MKLIRNNKVIHEGILETLQHGKDTIKKIEKGKEFGTHIKDFNDIKSEIASLQKGELIIKDDTMALLGISGKNYKKIKVTHLI